MSMMIDIYKILNLGIAFSTQHDIAELLNAIVDQAISITNADGGTLYSLEDDTLIFKILRNKSMNTHQGSYGEKIDLPPVPLTEDNVCSYAALHRELINIQDVYSCTQFAFQGPKRYDSITGYHTKSMLVMPLQDNRNRIVGVLQLINAMDSQGNVIEFDEDYEFVFRSIAMQAAIAVTNMRYTAEIEDSFFSFIEVMASAVDERTPYNARHTHNVANYTLKFVEYINELQKQGKTDIVYTENDKEQLVIAAWLHDIGKIVTPIEVMNKATRLDPHYDDVRMRLEHICLNNKVDFYEGRKDEAAMERCENSVTCAIELITRLDTAPFITDDDVAAVKEIAENRFVDIYGRNLPWLSEYEVECLSIRYGTLTQHEREIMESHVSITRKLLEKIKFTSDFKNVADIASAHHERLNGKGYPNHLHADDLSVGVRILGIMDVFEALTAADRPYKKAKTPAVALDILDDMVAKGDLDGKLVALLRESHIWEKPHTMEVE